jgi:hypothetical protein
MCTCGICPPGWPQKCAPVESVSRGWPYLWNLFPLGGLTCGICSPLGGLNNVHLWNLFPLDGLTCGICSPWVALPVESVPPWVASKMCICGICPPGWPQKCAPVESVPLWVASKMCTCGSSSPPSNPSFRLDWPVVTTPDHPDHLDIVYKAATVVKLLLRSFTFNFYSENNYRFTLRRFHFKNTSRV